MQDMQGQHEGPHSIGVVMADYKKLKDGSRVGEYLEYDRWQKGIIERRVHLGEAG